MSTFHNQRLVTDIEERLDRLSQRIKSFSGNGLNDAAKFLEPFAARLLNLIYDWHLTDPNPGVPNTKAIDLVDTTNKVAVQVTIQESSEKLRHTKAMLKDGRLSNYETIVVFFLHHKKFQKSDALRIINIGTLIGDLIGRPAPFLKQVAALLDEEIGNQPAYDIAAKDVDSPRHNENWSWTSVLGTELTLLSGTAGTASAPNGYPLATFPARSTVVLGAATTRLMETLTEKTLAVWNIPLATQSRELFDCGYIIIGSIRYFAGLHSKFYDSKVQIQLNNTFVDHISLRDKPPHHSHYFHRLPLPDFPRPQQIVACQNVYAWPLLREALIVSESQVLTITIDNYVRWDIDYVGLLVKTRVQ